MSQTLGDRIADSRVHVLDGAMGTMLYNRGVFVNVCYDELCLSRPDVVKAVHEAYVHAGAEIIETNTFGANPVKLSSYGLDVKTEEINRAAATIAQSVAGAGVSVAGAIGPLGIRIEPFGPTAREEADTDFPSGAVWVDKEEFLTLKAEFNNAAGVLEQTVTLDEFAEFEGEIVSNHIEVANVLDGSRTTVRIQERRTVEPELPDEIFTPEALPEFRPSEFGVESPCEP
jgi:S-methylmethionine-dependent homocysteine/selenocysteine methylase